jgi:hypothetical protein
MSCFRDSDDTDEVNAWPRSDKHGRWYVVGRGETIDEVQASREWVKISAGAVEEVRQ